MTARVRLTLLYSMLFALFGAVLISISYLLVASTPPKQPGHESISMEEPQKTDFLERCRGAANSGDPNLVIKCEQTFGEGVVIGARTQRQATLDNLLRYSLITLGAATALAALSGWFVAGRVLDPVHRITEAARNASQHNLSARVALTGPRDELRDLADTFDGMLGRLESAFHSQRQFIANAGHELRTPLTVMRTAVDVVLAKPAAGEEDLRAMGREVRSAVEQADRLIDALLTLARNEHGLHARERADLATVVEDAADAFTDRRLETVLSPAPVRGDPVLLERLAANLLDNALRYNVPGGRVWVTTGVEDGNAVLTVANTGPHIDPTDAGGLFEPFRRLADRITHDGFGLGLALVASIASVHGGTATATPRPGPDGGGLTVTVRLPVADSLARSAR